MDVRYGYIIPTKSQLDVFLKGCIIFITIISPDTMHWVRELENDKVRYIFSILLQYDSLQCPGYNSVSLDWRRTIQCGQTWGGTGGLWQLQGDLRYRVVVASQSLLGLNLHWLVWRGGSWGSCWRCCWCCWSWWWRWWRCWTINTGVSTTIKAAEAVIRTVWR